MFHIRSEVSSGKVILLQELNYKLAIYLSTSSFSEKYTIYDYKYKYKKYLLLKFER